MNRRRPIYLLVILSVLISACGTSPKRVNPTGDNTIVTTHDINVKDWQTAAKQCINSLLESGTLERDDGRKTIVMVGNVKNRTTEHVNTSILTNKIREAILQSGKAVTTTAVGASGPEDSSTRDVRELKHDEVFHPKTIQKNGTAISPDMSLAGSIIQQKTKYGRKEESYFFFHMTLTDLKTGLALWEDNVEIVKQNKKPFVGY
jgi:penicillin-binding protein activator